MQEQMKRRGQHGDTTAFVAAVYSRTLEWAKEKITEHEQKERKDIQQLQDEEWTYLLTTVSSENTWWTEQPIHDAMSTTHLERIERHNRRWIQFREQKNRQQTWQRFTIAYQRAVRVALWDIIENELVERDGIFEQSMTEWAALKRVWDRMGPTKPGSPTGSSPSYSEDSVLPDLLTWLPKQYGHNIGSGRPGRSATDHYESTLQSLSQQYSQLDREAFAKRNGISPSPTRRLEDSPFGGLIPTAPSEDSSDSSDESDEEQQDRLKMSRGRRFYLHNTAAVPNEPTFEEPKKEKTAQDIEQEIQDLFVTERNLRKALRASYQDGLREVVDEVAAVLWPRNRTVLRRSTNVSTAHEVAMPATESLRILTSATSYLGQRSNSVASSRSHSRNNSQVSQVPLLPPQTPTRLGRPRVSVAPGLPPTPTHARADRKSRPSLGVLPGRMNSLISSLNNESLVLPNNDSLLGGLSGFGFGRGSNAAGDSMTQTSSMPSGLSEEDIRWVEDEEDPDLDTGDYFQWITNKAKSSVYYETHWTERAQRRQDTLLLHPKCAEWYAALATAPPVAADPPPFPEPTTAALAAQPTTADELAVVSSNLLQWLNHGEQRAKQWEEVERKLKHVRDVTFAPAAHSPIIRKRRLIAQQKLHSR
eukprot:TRINITY_DN84688_c0_g1_i1.p1 TRINITY_DN84688_c0_g1~~TRINITY_DN84688_c0_g1_i1.p1  ORF type:complete len:646 (+),score=43.95 TRINITY_DN84688_c0_g1_i1:441-2378(+)